MLRDLVATLQEERLNLLALLRECFPLVKDAAQETCGYGYPWAGLKAADFQPDHECCSPEEIAAHKAAVEAEAAVQPEQASCNLVNGEGQVVGHITRTPWGIGTYSYTDPKAAALLEKVQAVLGPAPTGATTEGTRG